MFTNPKADSSQGVCENVAGTTKASITSPSSNYPNALAIIDTSLDVASFIKIIFKAAYQSQSLINLR